MGTKRVGLARVEALMENLKRELALDGASFKGAKRPVESVTAATKAVTTAESGTIFTLNRAAGITVTLPAATAGLEYEFHIGTTFTGTLTIDAASAADTLQGHLLINDKDELGSVVALNENIDTTAIALPAAADHQIVMDANTKGRFIGGHIKYTCISDSKWIVSGVCFADGTVVTPFT